MFPYLFFLKLAREVKYKSVGKNEAKKQSRKFILNKVQKKASLGIKFWFEIKTAETRFFIARKELI